MLLALAVALPFMLLTAGIVWQLANNERETRREAILFSARTLMNAVDTILNKQIAVGADAGDVAVAANGDFAAFRQEAERTRPGLSGGWIVLSDESGQQLINLKMPPGEPLPPRQGMALQRRAHRDRASADLRRVHRSRSQIAHRHGRDAGHPQAASHRSASAS